MVPRAHPSIPATKDAADTTLGIMVYAQVAACMVRHMFCTLQIHINCPSIFMKYGIAMYLMYMV